MAPADVANAWHRPVGLRTDVPSATLSILAEPAMPDGVRRVRIGRYGQAVLRGGGLAA
jgi:hypothetical protein